MTRTVRVPSTTETRTMETIIIKRFRPIRFARINARIYTNPPNNGYKWNKERERKGETESVFDTRTHSRNRIIQRYFEQFTIVERGIKMDDDDAQDSFVGRDDRADHLMLEIVRAQWVIFTACIHLANFLGREFRICWRRDERTGRAVLSCQG